MPQSMNPYGVGESRQKGDLRTGRCQCCKNEFVGSGPNPKYLDRCYLCQLHDTSTREGELRALRDHADSYLRIQQGARQIASDTIAERLAMQEKMISALRSRDRWRRVVDEIEKAHAEAPGSCICGNRDCDIPSIVRDAHKQADRAEELRDEQYMSVWDNDWKRRREYEDRFRKIRVEHRRDGTA